MTKIYFCDFWPGFDPEHNLLKDVMRLALQSDIQICRKHEANDANIVLCSVFGNEKQRYPNIPRIAYIGENLRPVYDHYEYSLSFDSRRYEGRNVRFPLWAWSFDWLENNLSAYSRKSYEFLFEGKAPPSFLARERKCAALIGNPVRWRLEHLKKINRLMPVDACGMAFARPLSGGRSEKRLFLSNYQFHYCSENSLYPGYITEKIIDARLSGCIPIYHSGNNIDNELNTKSIIDLALLDSGGTLFDEAIIHCDPIQMASEPLFSTIFSIGKLVDSIASLCANIF